MYPLVPFRSSDPAKIAAVMRAFPLATLISPAGGDDGWPTITQVPLVHHPERGARGSLLGHFDANNPHGPALVREPRVTCLFHGPNHYITPSIYPVEHYPGWNYVTVRVRAEARTLDRERVRALLFELAERHEPTGSGYVLRSEQRNFERYLDMVFGFELEIVEASAIFKLAQDKGRACADLAAVHLAREVRDDVLPLLRELLREED